MEEVLIITIIFVTIYKVIEIFVRKKERLMLIEKLDKLDLSKESKFDLGKLFGSNNNFLNVLSVSCLILGVGLGILIGYLIVSLSGLTPTIYGERPSFYVREQITVIYASTSLLFGGIGLLTSYFIGKKDKK